MTPTSALEIALDFIRQGRAVFPALPDAKRSYLAARYSGGSRWGASHDELAIRAWFKRWPDARCGLPTGAGLTVVDFDFRNGAVLDEDRWPATARVQTPSGGVHLYYRDPEPTRSNAGEIGPGMDVRGEGGMVVAYQRVAVDGLTEAPTGMFLSERERSSGGRGSGVAFDFADEPIPLGLRHDYLKRAAAWFKAYGYDGADLEQAMRDEYQRVCDPPGDVCVPGPACDPVGGAVCHLCGLISWADSLPDASVGPRATPSKSVGPTEGSKASLVRVSGGARTHTRQQGPTKRTDALSGRRRAR
jgi:hypothetical protein